MNSLIWIKKPASEWKEGFPVGNGVLAGMVMGGIQRERIALNHEWLWRGSPEENQKRVEDVSTIYTTSSTTIAKMLLAKYSVSYVIVGSFERERFPTLYEEKFLKLGKKVFSSGQTSIYLLDN